MENSDDKIFLDNRFFTILITGLIFYSVLCFSLDTLPDLSSRVQTFLDYSETCIAILFTIEYCLRIYLSEKKLKFIFSFYGFIDLLSILPFYLSVAVDLRSLRILRLFRVLRVLKITRYNSAVKRFTDALYLAKEELLIYMIASFMMIYLSAMGIYHFEHAAQPDKFRSVFDCLWWAVSTLTTVGYGDIYPVTFGGRIFTYFILMIGLGMVSVPAGIISSSLSSVRLKNMK